VIFEDGAVGFVGPTAWVYQTTEHWKNIGTGADDCVISFTGTGSGTSVTPCSGCTFVHDVTMNTGITDSGDCTLVGYANFAASHFSPAPFGWAHTSGAASPYSGTMYWHDGNAWHAVGYGTLAGSLAYGGTLDFTATLPGTYYY
jgi:hypothetical protein